MAMMKKGYRGHKHSPRDDIWIVKWVQDYDGVVTAAASESACHNFASETGLISDLHDECLRLIKELRTAWQNSQDNIDLKSQERAEVGYCYGKLYLWGDILQGGKLEASLEIVPALRQTILGTLVKIGHALLLAFRNRYKLSDTTSSEHSQLSASNLQVLIEKASHVLTAEDSDLSTLQEPGATDEESSNDESASDGEDKSPSPRTKPWTTALLRVLRFRTKLLMDLLPTIQQILTTTERGQRPDKTRPSSKFHASEAARQWVRQVFDRFQDADESLAERLGEANAQRYDELRPDKDQSDSAVVLHEGVDQAKSLFRPATTIRDSGLGTSIITPAEMPASVASQSSFLPSIADGTSRRVPKTPDAVALGIPFQCEICTRTLSTIKDRTQWKIHVFTDIKPYVCTFNDCKDQLTVFPTRKLWAEHEFRNHRCRISFECYICSQHLDTEEMLFNHLRNEHSLTESRPGQLEAIIVRAKNVQARPIEGERCPLCRRADWQTQRAFVKHLGKHLEDIALLALPLGDDSENETEGDDPYDKTSRGSSTKARGSKKAMSPSLASDLVNEPSLQKDPTKSEERLQTSGSTMEGRFHYPSDLRQDHPGAASPPTSTTPITPPPQPEQPAREKRFWHAETVNRSFAKAAEIRDVSQAQIEAKLTEVITEATHHGELDTTNWSACNHHAACRRCYRTKAKCDFFRPCTHCNILGILCDDFEDITESFVTESSDEESDAENSGSETFEIAMDDEKKHTFEEDEISRENAHDGGEHAAENNKGAKDEDEEMHNAEAARPPTEFHSNIIQPSAGPPLSPSSDPLLRSSSHGNPSILLRSDSGVPTTVADPDEQELWCLQVISNEDHIAKDL
ncbi:uncharacterized protein A1O5_09435 [Cladophialophora psammophila CBS 110553]|uniref:C2H2-type domain-containing protein n=1 Tax=Cladophialophora psammophila CBS 110553 TaxID=1182543 RepID=W9WH25_9EURO|nr:uncharacterized protein A1O5_09435 [Cladophialophora psammophila CBS 110553]EXJ67422.1 hypothetical protein A1O5_09435 [Cladophialophora psammophila CBS 110553]